MADDEDPRDWPRPSVYIQWKGTEVCLDFHCVCGPGKIGHFDGGFAYAVKCPDCGRVYRLPDTLTLTELGPDDFHYGSAKMTERDDEWWQEKTTTN